MTDFAARATEQIWFGTGPLPTLARAVLVPAERTFGAVVGARDLMYDAGWLTARDTAIPCVSVGNLSVGGTGKTPIAAWIARRLADHGGRPAIVLRGYGADEPLVHRLLNPDVPVIVGADRVQAVARAARDGATVAVLDDAFQHRRARRVLDLVLVSADRWSTNHRLLPAGPWREPLGALRRASIVAVTRKAADDAMVARTHDAIARAAPQVPRVGIALRLTHLVSAADPRSTEPLARLRDADVYAVLSIGDPRSFVRQLEALGARVHARSFADHHAFSRADVEQIARALPDDALVVCTLKDAVKLDAHWPRLAPPLWYVSQQVMVERGVGGLEHLIDALAEPRSGASPTAG